MAITARLIPYIFALIFVAACGSTPVTPTGDTANPGTDADASVTPDVPTPPPSGCGEDQVTLTFTVDDSANKTYSDGELIWTGSFSYDEATRTIVYATSWLPEEGPYPALYDDGPWSEGGHEKEGAVAGDHIFSTSVCYTPVEDKLMAYGVLNDDFRWIWVGPNGQIEVTADATGTIEVPGMTIAPFGSQDLRVTLDLGALHPDFEGVDLSSYNVFIKGTMNSWTPIQLLDDGQGADEAADDGKVTYSHGTSLGPHDGLLSPGQEAQFVFVFAKEGVDPDEALEYKVEGDAAIEGVTAEGQCNEAWEPLTVSQQLDSKGKTKNTSVTLCAATPKPDCTEDTDCKEGETCVEGECVNPNGKPPEVFIITPAQGPAGGGTEVKISGENFTPESTVTFGEAAATIVEATATEITALTPANPLGATDVTVTTTAGSATFPAGFTYTDEATTELIATIEPNQVSPFGGEEVSIAGTGFDEACTLKVGNESVAVEVKTPSLLTFINPAHLPGTVKVELTCGSAVDSADLNVGGTWDGELGEWPDTAKLSTCDVDSDWGDENMLDGLWAVADSEYLYVGVTGQGYGALFGPNAIVVYVDTDFGAGTGVTDTTVLENDGVVDDALGGVIVFEVPGFGAEVAFATLNGAGTADPDNQAGWRNLSPTDDMPWLASGVIGASATGVEAMIPLSELFGEPAGVERSIGLVTVLVSGNGDYTSNQRIPSDTKEAANLVFTY